jgi:hypothetical protein
MSGVELDGTAGRVLAIALPLVLLSIGFAGPLWPSAPETLQAYEAGCWEEGGIGPFPR